LDFYDYNFVLFEKYILSRKENNLKMKKILYLFSFLILVLTSCSNDDNSSPEESLILPKTISYTYPNSPEKIKNNNDL
jgi:hypothetical protein